MDKANFDKYLEERYYPQLKYYKESSAKNQKKYKIFQWLLIILSALTPVFAALNGLKLSPNTDPIWTNLNLFVVFISSIVAILTTGLKTFNYQELWITYRSTYERLKPEIHFYLFDVGPYSDFGIDKETLFVSRIEGILDLEHKIWSQEKNMPINKSKLSAKNNTNNNGGTFQDKNSLELQ